MNFGNKINLGLFVLFTITDLTAAAPIVPADENAKISRSELCCQESDQKGQEGCEESYKDGQSFYKKSSEPRFLELESSTSRWMALWRIFNCR